MDKETDKRFTELEKRIGKMEREFTDFKSFKDELAFEFWGDDNKPGVLMELKRLTEEIASHSELLKLLVKKGKGEKPDNQ